MTAPTVAPDPADAKRRRDNTFLIRGCAGLVIALVVIVIVAVMLLKGGTSTPDATPGPDPVTVGAPAPGNPVASWYTAGGKNQLDTLSTDMSVLAAAGRQQNTLVTAAGCVGLTSDVTKAKAYAPIPDAVAQRSWASALGHLQQGAADCATGAGNSDSSQIAKGVAEIKQGTVDFNAVAARIEALNARQ